MLKLSPTLISIGLLGAGVAVWALATPPLVARPDAKFPLNPLGINTSPYGEVFAMAMQGPIDTYWHGGADDHDHDHVHDEHSDHNHSTDAAAEDIAQTVPTGSMQNRYRDFLDVLSKMPEKRTNPNPASPAHKFYMRRGVEDKLRFAYQLDPAHYANYNTLHFFLTEPQMGTRPELTPSAAKLAQETIDYCLKQDNDPRPALTAAAACTNILHLMFADLQNDSPKYSAGQMRQCLGLLDHCISRYLMISKQWDESKNWELLSSMRITECEDRFRFITKVREAAEKTIIRLENESPNHQVAN